MFRSLRSSSSLLLPCFLFFLLYSDPVAAEDPLNYNCGSTGSYPANSTYKSNLNDLLPYLASNASLSGGFSKPSIGQEPDQVYGLALCRGDTNASLCLSCLNTASQDIVRLCPDYIEAVVWYDTCLLRYSSLWFVTAAEDYSEWIIIWNANDIMTDTLLFKRLVNELLSAIADRAAYNTTRRFATGEVNFTADFPKIYGLVQCTPDLLGDACRQCLQELFDYKITTTFQGKQGLRALRVRCNFRYEVYKFYDGASTLKLRSPTPATKDKGKEGNSKNITGAVLKIAIPLVSSTLLISIACICFWKRRKSAKSLFFYEANLEEITGVESLSINLSILRAATANFSREKKLGKGGFGAVYKGTLPNGQELAVKRLSATSRQGLAELKNELVSVARLRHKNLVKLLGACLEKQEKLLVYEYIPNRSLDTILFDPIKRGQLHWEKRYKIINGVARGLLYLHEDSQLKIVHRDLKASNILLDADMNPKISDFGLAKLFGGDESQSITDRIIGTFGYMAPEYITHGRFSTKSDVYSYGVLVLEIITGRKNGGIFYSATGKYLLTYIWERWNNGTVLEMVDPCLRNHCPKTEVLRCIQIGLLCIQENPFDRPNMSMVVMMLNNDPVSIQAPSQPAFSIGQFDSSGGLHNQTLDRAPPMSINEVSITELKPR